MANNENLHLAKVAKNDEFYTQLTDVEKEMLHYRKHFNGATVLCNCDDPFESAFFKYFVLNFNRLHLKKLISTCYSGSQVAGSQLSLFDLTGDESKRRKPYKAIVTSVHDTTGDGGIDMDDIKALFKSGENELTELEGDGDFRSPECLALMDEADIVCSNPPWSLFRQYLALLMEHDKKFIIVGNKNAVTYKEVFPLLKDNKLWIGARSMNKDFWLKVPDGASYEKMVDGIPMKHIMACWFTNLDLKKRHEELILVKRYTPEAYPHYDNYDAIEVSKVADIPCDYAGIMGLPVTWLDKYNPEQFEIIGATESEGKGFSQGLWNEDSGVAQPMVAGNRIYKRIFIRNLHPEAPKEV